MTWTTEGGTDRMSETSFTLHGEKLAQISSPAFMFLAHGLLEHLDRPRSEFAKDATYGWVKLMTCSYCCLNFVQIQCWPHEILGLLFQRVKYCFPPRFELWVTGSMQHIQFEREQEVTAANENAALPDLNCGGIKLMY